jgi:D-arabinose 1-dehydrogenase-like Zn-dependent alcohol dehydrogenase
LTTSWKIDVYRSLRRGYYHTISGRILDESPSGISREYLYVPLDYVAKAKVKVMAETFPLDDVADAYQKVANGKVHFRAVINA